MSVHGDCHLYTFPPLPTPMAVLCCWSVGFSSVVVVSILAHGMVGGPEKLTGNACSWSVLCGISLSPVARFLAPCTTNGLWLILLLAYGAVEQSLLNKHSITSQNTYLSLWVAVAVDKGSEQVKGSLFSWMALSL